MPFFCPDILLPSFGTRRLLPDIGVPISGHSTIRCRVTFYPISDMISCFNGISARITFCFVRCSFQGPSQCRNDSDSDRSGDCDMDADDLRDCEDQLPSIQPTSPADLGPYDRFLQSMPDYFDMTQEEFARAVDTLPHPSSGPPPLGILIHEAVQASYTRHIPISYPISCMISYHGIRYLTRYRVQYLTGWISSTLG
jgi:hypothetical protein